MVKRKKRINFMVRYRERAYHKKSARIKKERIRSVERVPHIK